MISNLKPSNCSARETTRFPGTQRTTNSRRGIVAGTALFATATGLPTMALTWMWNTASGWLPATGPAVSSTTIFVMMALLFSALAQLAAILYGLVSIPAVVRAALVAARTLRHNKQSAANRAPLPRQSDSPPEEVSPVISASTSNSVCAGRALPVETGLAREEKTSTC